MINKKLLVMPSIAVTLAIITCVMGQNSFIEVGTTSPDLEYTNIVIKFNIKDILQKFNLLKQIITFNIKYNRNQFPNDQERMAEERQIEIIEDRVQLITLIAKGTPSIQLQQLTQYQNETFNKIVANLPNQTTTERSRGRRAIRLPSSRMITGFLKKLFSLAQYANLVSSAISKNRVEDGKVFFANDTSLKVNALFNHMQLYKQRIKELAAKSNMTNQGMAQSIHVHVRPLTNIFRASTQDFLIGLTSLLQGRLSPFLVNPDEIMHIFKNVQVQIQAYNKKTVSSEVMSLFYEKTSAVVYNDTLFAIVHVPILKDNPLKLHKYIPSPHFIDDNTVLTIDTPQKYLALDDAGLKGLLFTQNQIEDCTIENNFYKCRNNILIKDLDSLCLYNLYYMQIEKIQQTCTIFINNCQTLVIG